MAEGRHFFALWPDQAVQERLELEAREAAAQGRLHQQSDLHMTLIFLGEISDSQLRCVEQMADAIRGEPFTMKVDGIAYWYRPRILWAGPRETPEPLSRLVLDLQNGLKACGFEPERRRFKPHVTLYRKAGRTHSRVIESAIEWSVNEFVLAVSGGGEPGGPRYRVLKRWSLGPAHS
jgi:2'-5' RNA ligase